MSPHLKKKKSKAHTHTNKTFTLTVFLTFLVFKVVTRFGGDHALVPSTQLQVPMLLSHQSTHNRAHLRWDFSPSARNWNAAVAGGKGGGRGHEEGNTGVRSTMV